MLILLSVVLLSSCGGFKEVEVGNVKNVELRGLNKNVLDVAVTLPIVNPNSFNLKLKDADLQVTNGETLIGTIKQMDDVVISKLSSKEYTLDLKIELVGSNLNLLSLYSLFNGHPDLKLSGTVKVRSFPYRGKIKIKDYQLIR